MTLNEYFLEDQRDYLEMTSMAVATGYISARKGRQIKMFKDSKAKESNRVSPEAKRQELDYLKGLF